MKKLLVLMAFVLLAAGCVAVPVYDDGYYHPYTYDSYGPYVYAPYPYGYWDTGVVFIGNGGHGFHGGHGFRGGRGFGGGRR